MLLITRPLLLRFVGVITAPTAPIIDLGYAQYEGTLDPTTGNAIFLGMRYAAAPTGSLRWRAPQAPATVAGVQQANAQPPSCNVAGFGLSPPDPSPQQVLKIQAAAVESEDCLFLNVFTPKFPTDPGGRRPVVVWIHGGGYQEGSASTFNGQDLIRKATGGVVAVVIQYRLGAFGFLAGSKVKAGGALNAGLLDQQFALQWVQSHITQFGGDPKKVTIWGESAGAGSVLQHVIAHDGKTNPPLFRAAISSSSYLPPQYDFDDSIPEAQYSNLVSLTNCTSSADTLTCLQRVDIATLQAANVNISTSAVFGTSVFVPVVDGTLITQRPTLGLKQRKVNGLALLTVMNTFEGFIFVDQNSTIRIPAYIGQLFPKFGTREITRAAALYASLGTPISQADAIMGESIFQCPTYFLLRPFFGQSWKAEFAIPPAHHGDDIQYYFPSQTPSGFPAFNNTAFDRAFSEQFLDFAMRLNPNVKARHLLNIIPPWNTWDIRNTEMLFNRTADGAPLVKATSTSSTLLDRCTFWESVSALSAQ
ncbi:Alpha/Beta hydrolase protein [Lyophyllum atratum]|nr:Alpha/Beta hydrolase protein [Lyophyllum atratum]